MRIGFFVVLFHGPRKRSGGVTGQNWHPLSGSEIVIVSPKRVTFSWTKSASSMTSSGFGGANGLLSLQDTAERSRSTSSFSFTASRTADASPDMAAANVWAVSGQLCGDARRPIQNTAIHFQYRYCFAAKEHNHLRRARPLVRMPGMVALGTGRGSSYSLLMKSSTRLYISVAESLPDFARAHPDGPACTR